MKFVILLEKSADDEAFRAVVPAHVSYMERLHEQGVLIAGGPFGDGEGGMIVIDVASEAAARAVAKADPFVEQKVEGYVLRRWEVLTPVRPALLSRDG